ncbi:FAD dependent oxidoreductase-domain-containing protein [Triangularia setosa]|uniref:FAD dependent oxidoreductase-domain-containing protein n=1 Tax=Triangularia setosa TaxID=2587417 RepID=A0AAN6WBG1_9PEZI|nr:FAD dependent oxidoreductase-domain-containing protein [Podospora setosa]
MEEQQKRNIVIIGGGIIGCTTAYFLTRHPKFNPNLHSITLLEATAIAAGASGKAGGLLALWAYPQSLVPLSYRLHKELATEHNGAERWGYRRVGCGTITATVTNDDLHARAKTTSQPSSFLQNQEHHGNGTDINGQSNDTLPIQNSVSGPPANGDNGYDWQRLPKQDEDATTLLKPSALPQDLDWFDSVVVQHYQEMGQPGATETAQVHPFHFTTSIAALAKEKGVDIRIGVKVTRLKYNSEKTEVIGLEYEDREIGQLRGMNDVTDVVVAAGPWTGKILPRTKIEGLRAHSVVYEADVTPYAVFTDINLPADFVPEHRARKGQKRKHKRNVDPEVYARPFGEVYACGEPDPSVALPETADLVQCDDDQCDDLTAYMATVSPVLGTAPIKAKQACYLPRHMRFGTERDPVIGQSYVKGLWIASGHTCWGIQNGPGTGCLMAEMILDGEAKSADIRELEPRKYKTCGAQHLGAYSAYDRQQPNCSAFRCFFSKITSIKSTRSSQLYLTTTMEVAGAVVGVISLGIQAAQCLVQYYTTVKDQKTDTARTISKLNRLLSILNSLDGNIKARKFQPEEQILVKTIQGAIQECEEYILELGEEAKKLTAPAVPKRLTRTASSNIEAFARTAARRVTYPFRRDTLQKLDETVDEICAGLILALQVVQQKNTTVIHDDITIIQDDIDDMKAVLNLMRRTQVASGTRTWLKAPDVSVNYREACKKRHPETGHWFVKEGVEFIQWLNQPNSFLWLNGFAGCGKSVLSSTVVEWTERHRKRISSGYVTSGLAFFYFTFNDESKQDTNAMLRSIILQLANQAKTGEEHLVRLKDAYPDTIPSIEALLDTLNALIEEFDDVYIILDALDESPKQKHRKTLLNTLHEIREWSDPRLHLLVTSRDEQDIREYLSPTDNEDVKMKNASIDSDIASFISGHLQTNRLLRRFRWVECQFTALESCPISKAHLHRLLASLPRSLDDTYERMLLNINPDWAEDARRILTLLCTATRPLSIFELIEAIAVELGDPPSFNRDRILVGEDDVLYICPGLLEFDQDSNVRIAHYSVQEFLQSDRISDSRASTYYVENRAANTEIATICLTYMLDPDISLLVDQLYSKAKSKEKQDAELSQMPLMFYAAGSWKAHYNAADKMNSTLHSLILQLFCSIENKGSQTLFLRYIKPDHCIFTVPSMSAIVSASENGFDLVR